jgi:hypothetical protein
MLTILAYVITVIAITALVLLVVGIIGVISGLFIKDKALSDVVEETGELSAMLGSLTWFSVMTVMSTVSLVLSLVATPVSLAACLFYFAFAGLGCFIVCNDAVQVSRILPRWQRAFSTWKGSKIFGQDIGLQSA